MTVSSLFHWGLQPRSESMYEVLLTVHLLGFCFFLVLVFHLLCTEGSPFSLLIVSRSQTSCSDVLFKPCLVPPLLGTCTEIIKFTVAATPVWGANHTAGFVLLAAGLVLKTLCYLCHWVINMPLKRSIVFLFLPTCRFDYLIYIIVYNLKTI